MNKLQNIKNKWAKIKNNKVHVVKKATLKFTKFSIKQKKVLT